ncbi:hypothetical protein RS030_7948 [Cryptosporidium xiaoi]|uniref:C3H1-type domain-containing protein n=1 Tax=Cryptosporidium xiaoi TaxID=659607 RepID=A0AAV9XW49_9CRYT
MPQFYKTKRCPWFAVGRCRMDKDCNWAHSTEELRPSVDLTRTKLCDVQIKEGICRNPNCRYAHSRKELRATSDLFKTSLCIYWIKGSCAVGDACRYAHGIEELRAKPQKGEFIPLEVETLSGPIPKPSENKKDIVQFEGRNSVFHDNRLSHPYSAGSITTGPSSVNRSGFESDEKLNESIPPFVANLFDFDCNKAYQKNQNSLTGIDKYQIQKNRYTPVNVLDNPFIWGNRQAEQRYINQNQQEYPFSANSIFNCQNLNNQNQFYLNTPEMVMNNRMYYNEEIGRNFEVNPMPKSSYSEGLEEFYSYTPSTASSIKEKTNLHNLEISL